MALTTMNGGTGSAASRSRTSERVGQTHLARNRASVIRWISAAHAPLPALNPLCIPFALASVPTGRAHVCEREEALQPMHAIAGHACDRMDGVSRWWLDKSASSLREVQVALESADRARGAPSSDRSTQP